MPNPFANQARSGSKSKFKAMMGKAGGGQVYGGESSGGSSKGSMASTSHGESRVSGSPSKGRIDKYARGGKVPMKVTIINAPQGDKAAPSLPPVLPSPPLGLPPGAGPLPPPAAGGPPLPPLGMAGPGGPPGMKTGGRVAKARGGRFTGGAESGVGRLEKKAHAKGRR